MWNGVDVTFEELHFSDVDKFDYRYVVFGIYRDESGNLRFEDKIDDNSRYFKTYEQMRIKCILNGFNILGEYKKVNEKYQIVPIEDN